MTRHTRRSWEERKDPSIKGHLFLTDAIGQIVQVVLVSKVLAFVQRDRDVLIYMRSSSVLTAPCYSVAQVSKALERDCPESAADFVAFTSDVLIRPDAVRGRKESLGRIRVHLHNGHNFWVSLSTASLKEI